ncbi:MAG TPA: hypothetical protein VF125_02970 [Solirubrobacterales bacterium]
MLSNKPLQILALRTSLFWAAIVLSFLTSSLFAVPASGAEIPNTIAGFKVHGTNGFEITVVRNDRIFEIVARRPGAEVSYLTLVTVPATNGVQANLGSLGAISVRFKPLGPRKRLPNLPEGCYRARSRGVFVGGIDFHGEEEFTEAVASRAKGEVIVSRGDCDTFDRPFRSQPAPQARLVPTEVGLFARHLSKTSLVRFECSEGAGSDLAPIGATDPDRRYFKASVDEKRGRISIYRSITGTSDDPSTFTFNTALTLATAAPPPPFIGTATLERENRTERGSWTGTLTASFPGASNVALAGPTFTATMNFYRYEEQ